uniref:Conserved plasma membrane protein n=2 Tax=Macrostomum lignano TaxID=282301 RepID=A0A1I8H045_9PLAT
MAYNGNEKIIDDPVMVNGKFVRNVGSRPSPSMYKYVYLKDGDKDFMKRADLAVRVGGSLGVTVGIFHLATFGRNPKFPSRWEPIYKIAYSWAGGIMASLLHAGTVSISSQLQGGRDLVRNWALGGAVSGAFIYSIVRMTPARQSYLARVPLTLAAICAAIKIAVIYDKPLQGHPVTSYGMVPLDRTLGPRHYDTINPYRKQEEHYLEKYL